MQQTRELLVAIFKSINSYVAARADGKFDEKDLGFLIPLFFAWQAAIKDLRFAGEAKDATPASIEAMFAEAADQELTAVSSRTKFIILNMFKGAYVTYWAIAVPAFEAGARYALDVVKLEGQSEGILKLEAEIARLSAT